MVNAMEGTLHEFKNNTTVYIEEEDHIDSPPALISDSSSCCSSDEEQVLPKKKRSATIPNFLFRNKKKEEVNIKRRNQSLHDHNWVPRKPVARAASILSITS
jgi:hypothetical protein